MQCAALVIKIHHSMVNLIVIVRFLAYSLLLLLRFTHQGWILLWYTLRFYPYFSLLLRLTIPWLILLWLLLRFYPYFSLLLRFTHQVWILLLLYKYYFQYYSFRALLLFTGSGNLQVRFHNYFARSMAMCLSIADATLTLTLALTLALGHTSGVSLKWPYLEY